MSSVDKAARQLRHMLMPLEHWRNDPAVADICINKPNKVFVRRAGCFEQHNVMLDFNDCYDIAVLAGALNAQNVNETMPLLSADLPDGERLQAVLPPCVPPGTVSLTMRIHEENVVPLVDATRRYGLDKWNRWGARRETRRAEYATLLATYDSGDVNRFFHELVRLRFNMLLCGKTGAGKSTFLKSLMSVIRPNERIITIENALELTVVNQPNHVRLVYSHGSQGTARVTQNDLLEAYLRMRPDRGFVGELRDRNAAYAFISEVTTGHLGSATTIHGNDAHQAAQRLFNLFKASDEGKNYSDPMVVSQLGMAVDAIVPFREVDGRHEIGEVWFSADAQRRGASFAELLEPEREGVV